MKEPYSHIFFDEALDKTCTDFLPMELPFCEALELSSQKRMEGRNQRIICADTKTSMLYYLMEELVMKVTLQAKSKKRPVCYAIRIGNAWIGMKLVAWTQQARD